MNKFHRIRIGFMNHTNAMSKNRCKKEVEIPFIENNLKY